MNETIMKLTKWDHSYTRVWMDYLRDYRDVTLYNITLGLGIFCYANAQIASATEDITKLGNPIRYRIRRQ